MTLVEGATSGVLSAKAHGSAGFDETSEGERFGHAVVDRTLSRTHFCALLEKLLHLGVNVEGVGVGGESSCEIG